MPPGAKRAAWRSLIVAHSALVRLMDDELQAECATPLQWYDVLIRIWLSPDHRLRMSELADSALLSRSWITRRVEQLESAGLVGRFSADDDGRGVCVALTAEGEAAFLRLEASHSRSIDHHFSRYMTAEEAAVIARVLDRVAAAGHDSLSGTGR